MLVNMMQLPAVRVASMICESMCPGVICYCCCGVIEAVITISATITAV